MATNWTVGTDPFTSELANVEIELYSRNHPEVRDTVFETSGIDTDEDKDEEVEDGDLPPEIRGLKEKKIKLFTNALRYGQKENHRIRLVVLGNYAVGKTTLVTNLIENFDMHTEGGGRHTTESTEGIEVHLCAINTNNKWRKLKPNMKRRTIRRTLETCSAVPIQQPIPFVVTQGPADINEEEEEQPLEPMDTEPPLVMEQPQPLTALEENVKVYISENEPPRHQPSFATPTTAIPVQPEEPDEPDGLIDNKPFVSVWDFAGQNLYYSTHHFFLNKRSIYLLLMDMTMDLDSPIGDSAPQSGLDNKDYTCLEAFKFWINSIYMYSSLHDQETEIKPTIILVGTHKDKMNPDWSEDERKEEMAKFFNEALDLFLENKKINKHISEKKFLINNLDQNDPEYENIRTEVKRLAEKQSYWNKKHPVKWIQLEKEFDKARASGKEIVTFDDVKQMNTQIPVRLDDKEIRLFLEVEHLFGNILHFDTDELRNHVILSPQWIIEVFKCFINHKEKHIPMDLSQQWKEYKKCAKLSKDLVMNILTHSDYKIDCEHEVVINYMEYLNVMTKPVCPEDFPEDEDCTAKDPSCIDQKVRKCGDQNKPKFHDFYVVPCQLQTKPDCDMEKLTNPEKGFKTQALCFVFKDRFMPPATFHRLLVACMRHWEIAKTKGSMMLYNGFGAFKTCPRSQLRLWFHDHIIYARMVFQSEKYKDERAIDTEKCQGCRRVLYANLMAILGLLPRSKNLTKTTPYEEYIQCQKLTKHNKGLFRVNDFLVDEEIPCEDDHAVEELHTLNKHDALKFWYKDQLDAIEDERDVEFYDCIKSQLLPQEVTGLSDDKIKMFYSALLLGEKENQRIRLMVVGMFAVGKTTLVNNLIERNDNAQIQAGERQPILSTEGIEVHLCEIDESNKWKKLKPNMKKRKMRKVLEEQIAYVPQVIEAINERVVPVENIEIEAPMPEPIETEPLEVQPAPLHQGEQKLKAIMEAEEKTQSQPSFAKYRSMPRMHVEEIEEKYDEPDSQTVNKTFVSVWDFAGQNLYYSTHHFFLNKRSIYLLLMDMTKDLNQPINDSAAQSGIEHIDFTCHDAFKFWINSIHMYSSIHDQETEIKPTIILVGTHKDLMNPQWTEEKKNEEMAIFFNRALHPFRKNKEILKHISRKRFLINNLSENDPEHESIRKEVRRLAEEQSYWKEKHPMNWIQLEREFDKVRAAGKEIVTFDEVKKMNSEFPAPLHTDKDIRFFLEMQHLFGNILHFDTEELKYHVILSPQWIIDAFKCFINHKHEHITPELIEQWEDYQNCAKLSKKLLTNIFEHSTYKLDRQQELVINYMEHLNVMAKPICPEDFPEDEDCTADDTSCIEPNVRKHDHQNPSERPDFYIVPCQLKNKPDCGMEKLTNPERGFKTQALCFVFKDQFMPPATFHRLLVACMRYWEIAKTRDTMMLYNGFGAFKTSATSRLRLWYYDHIIYARMIFQSTRYQSQDDRAIDTNICQGCRRVLFENLMAILGLLPRSKNLTKSTPYEEYIQCPQLTKHNEGLFRVNAFLVDEEISCEDDHAVDESHIINKHDALKFWYKDQLDAIEDERDQEFERVPTEDDLSKIAQHLLNMKEIWLLGIELGVPNSKMEQLKMQHWKEGQKVFIFKMLMEWRNSKMEYLPKLRKTISAVLKNQESGRKQEKSSYDIYDCIKTTAPDNSVDSDAMDSVQS